MGMNNYVDSLIQGNATAARIIMENRVRPYTAHPARYEELKTALAKIVDGGLQNFFNDADVLRVFLFDENENTHVDFLAGADGVCLWQEADRNAAIKSCVIGVGLSALERGEDYLIFLLLHELTHGLLRFSEHDHEAKFHNQLDYLISLFNSHTGMSIGNDYSQLPESEKNGVVFYGKKL